MTLQEAREINGNVATWYINTTVLGKETTIPPYSKERMLEAFGIVDRANNLKVVRDDGKYTLCVVCAPRVADCVVEARGW
jgi:hypothetical protein